MKPQLRSRIHMSSIMIAAALAAAVAISPGQAHAAFVPVTLYATVLDSPTGDNGVYAVNVTAPGAFTKTLIDKAYYDSLTLDNAGNMFLTGGGAGTVTKLSGFNPALNTYTAKTTWTVSSDGATAIQDIVAEPAAVSLAAGLPAGHGSVLVSDMGTGEIGRVDTTTGTVTWLASGHNYATNTFSSHGRPGPEGLAYVPNPAAPTGFSLIASNGNRNWVGERALAELDPVTGAISTTNIRTSLSYNDGLGYDPSNGLLYSTNRVGIALYTGIDPLHLASYSIAETPVPSDGYGYPVQQLDGVAPDGLGNVYIASYDSVGSPGNIYMYDESLGTMTLAANIPGLDDIALTASVPNTGTTPEPASLSLLAIGGIALLARRKQRR